MGSGRLSLLAALLLLLSRLHCTTAMVTQPKVDKLDVVSQRKGPIKFSYDDSTNPMLDVGDVLTFTATASDPSGSALEFRWQVRMILLHVI